MHRPKQTTLVTMLALVLAGLLALPMTARAESVIATMAQAATPS